MRIFPGVSFLGLVLPGLSLTSLAFARSLQCNKAQTKCVVESVDLTVGDQVGVFNPDGELVASGEVSGMKGDRRAVLINERHGPIENGYKLTLLESKPTAEVQSVKVYRELAKLQVGASLGYSTVSVGSGSRATELSAYGQYRAWHGLLLVGRGVYVGAEGEITRQGDDAGDPLPVSIRGMGLLGGVGYELREKRPISFRGEAALGMMQIKATVDGDSGLVGAPGIHANVRSGMGVYGRWSLGMAYNMDLWHLHADFAESLVYEAFSNTIALGVSRELR